MSQIPFYHLEIIKSSKRRTFPSTSAGHSTLLFLFLNSPIHGTLIFSYTKLYREYSCCIIDAWNNCFLFVYNFGQQQKLERLQEDELVEKPFQRKQMKIRFPERGRSGRSVVSIKNLEFGFGDKVLLTWLNNGASFWKGRVYHLYYTYYHVKFCVRSFSTGQMLK